MAHLIETVSLKNGAFSALSNGVLRISVLYKSERDMRIYVERNSFSYLKIINIIILLRYTHYFHSQPNRVLSTSNGVYKIFVSKNIIETWK